MEQLLGQKPAYWFVVATLLPLASFVLLLLAGGLRWLFRRYRDNATCERLYEVFGGDRPGRTPAFVALGAIGLAFLCSFIGLVIYHDDHTDFMAGSLRRHQGKIAELQEKREKARTNKQRAEIDKEIEQTEEKFEANLENNRPKLHEHWETYRGLDERWKGTLYTLIRVQPEGMRDPQRGSALTIGYSIDHLAALMFVMVTFIATLIHLFSIGYMSEEAAETVEDHQVHTDEGHLHRRGRFGRFFMYLSLFCFSMLHLVLANNLFQVFVSWELVGICSYLLVGFYFERQSASNAANKAFITNRIGDAGFIIGLLILWGYLGTVNFDEMFSRLRSPETDAHGYLQLGGQFVRATPAEGAAPSKAGQELRITMPGKEAPGAYVAIFPRDTRGHFHGLGPRGPGPKGHAAPAKEGEDVHPEEFDFVSRHNPRSTDNTSMPYWMLVLAGLGIFLGCVGKSAQFPLQVWLPDAMEGPTPVSALIHAATMVAAGVYLVGRCYPLFTAEVLLVIAYTGAITLFVAATIAVVVTDIKKVLAYSTVSQLGYMMLALGIGGWTAGLFHLFTHAFFKALLFLGSGSVIYGCHHEQEMTKMGGLYPKMKITALTMLMGVLAIAGIPLFSGWYSKDSIIAQAVGYAYVNKTHVLLLLLPLATAGITTFYMFRMWFLTFTGEPRDKHVHEHAHESPWPMTVPLIVLAVCSVCVAWGWPLYDASKSHLEHTLHHAQPRAVLADFGHLDDPKHPEIWAEVAAKQEFRAERHWAHHYHNLAGVLALGMVGLGIVFASLTYYYRVFDPAEAKEQFPQVHAFLANKWYFDDLYSVLLVRPAMIVARAFRWFDQKAIDGTVHATASATVQVAKADGKFDNYFIDWLVNLVARVIYAVGGGLRNVQTGYLRSYVLFLVLGAVGLFVLLTYFVSLAAAR